MSDHTKSPAVELSAGDLDRLIRPKEVRRLFGISKSTEWRWRKSGLLPEPVRMGPRLRAYRRRDVVEALERLCP